MLAAYLPFLVAVASDADRVLVVENVASPASVEIATDYLRKRHGRNLLKVSCRDSALSRDDETLAYSSFKDAIEAPLATYLKSHPRIDFIVLTKGIPIRLTGAPVGVGGNQPSLDSYIASLGYPDRKDAIKVSLNDSGFTGACWSNNFWNSAARFSHSRFGGYLVTRLDGYTVDDAKSLVQRALEAERTRPVGPILLDSVASHGLGDVAKVPRSVVRTDAKGAVVLWELNYNEWDADLVVAGERLAARKLPALLDKTDDFVGGKAGLMGYASWGSNDPKFSGEGYAGLRFAPGGIAETAVSTSARTFLPTTGGQSLIADLVRNGASGAKGYCDEPLLQAVASPTVLFDRYTRGWTLAESFYAASRFIGWEDIVVGDPLCRPYRP